MIMNVKMPSGPGAFRSFSRLTCSTISAAVIGRQRSGCWSGDGGGSSRYDCWREVVCHGAEMLAECIGNCFIRCQAVACAIGDDIW